MRQHYLTCLMCLSFTVHVSAGELSKGAKLKLSQSIEFEYQERMKVCDTLNWNASDVCEIQAYNKKLVDQAALRANIHPTAKNRQNALLAHVNAKYEVAITECNDLDIEARQPCWEAAEVERKNGVQQIISDQ